MSAATNNTATSNNCLANRLTYLRWLMSHVEELPQLWQIFTEFQAAADLNGKWTALKKAGDLLVAIATDFPHAQSLAVVTVAEYDAVVMDLAAARGFDGARLKKLLEFLDQWLPIVLKLLNG